MQKSTARKIHDALPKWIVLPQKCMMFRRGQRAELPSRSEVVGDGTLANLATVRRSFFDRLAKVKSNEHARIRILVCRLRETGERADRRRRIAAGAAGGERRATILKADLIGAEKLFQHFRRCSALDGVTRGVVLVRRCLAQRDPGFVPSCIRIAVVRAGSNRSE